MAATYTKITRGEMEQQLKSISNGFEVAPNQRAQELIYEAKFKKIEGMAIRVYSSIDKRSDNSRKKGSDAIRVCLTFNNRIIGGSKRVNRTQNWKTNLKDRATELGRSVSKLKCDCDTGYMVERESKNGKFYGCSEYPRCKITKRAKTKK